MSPRKLTGGRLVVASHNKGKVREIGALLAPYGFEAIPAGALGLAEPDETGTTFAANAELKARAAARAANLPALADDSGLEVAALGGSPGIYSARWAGGNGGDFTAAMDRVRREMAASGNADASARFVCALSVAWPDGHVETVEGEVKGHVVFPPRGSNGFGYDPIFVAAGYTQTFGEMDADAKHAISHRADAFRKLVARVFERAA